ncbi:flagellar basal body protein FliL [Desulfovibrio aerotolerans]|uniref:Flagellar protein FliL n=1 Tax=Solidesulfovibrio aerotolerans TaxID=295255 RepID=A0A7C9IVU6_9BACT|nr:flagellar basal body-associated FliL family protein [Solidesulfovibrio aerotolerans]MYL84243.1 flagellar basal body protein FliL [Solidesulfovibrio aerotolerans]
MVDDDSLDAPIKAKLDDSELSDDLPKALQKVDLDLDDAPFLEDEPEEAPPSPEASGPSETPVVDDSTAKSSRKKRLILLGLIVLLLLGGGAAAYFLVLKKPAPKAPVEEQVPHEEPAPPPQMPPPPPPEPPAPKPEIVLTMDPFLIELIDQKGRSRFMTIRFSAATREHAVELEFKRNYIVVRDAVYYYLKNKSLEFLTDKNNADALKKDVLSVMNQFIGAQPLDNLLIEDYLVK